MRNVEIAVRLAPGATPPRGTVTLRAQVEEITAADARARVVSRTAERGVDLGAGARLTLEVPRPDPAARYTVRVHADIDGSGAVAPEDFVSVRSNPVLTHGGPDAVTVEVAPAG
ncbi:hypothetical protein [Streptomyces kanamyceticus]|uniref:Uncharacterized protein n=1 Tax=Streptomyces kanamyceticus TaxID=1967 RepID=A0A5J6GAM7_STRKN|nr:hypothetical protein [Streptomyces kanamyceticus]QEU90316.1 hypothetical protein CP970_04805 [Streptomyces kanamyceticus]